MTETEVLEPEMVKTTPLDNSSYKYLFNACRYPEKPEDRTEKFDPAQNNHIVVVRKGRFYEFEVVDSKGEFLSEKDLEKWVHVRHQMAILACDSELTGSRTLHRQFQRIQALAKSHDENPIGALTTENRDTWTDARQLLLKADSGNEAALRRIESAIIVVALDDAKPVTREEHSRALWVGDGKSRFFDKHQRECAVCLAVGGTYTPSDKGTLPALQ